MPETRPSKIAMCRCGSVFLLLLCLTTISAGQPVVSPALRAQQTLSSIQQTGLVNGTTYYGLAIPRGEVKGDYYWSGCWNLSRVILKDGKSIEGVLAKLDVKTGELHLLVSNEVKVLLPKFNDGFAWTDSLDHTEHFFVKCTTLAAEIPGHFVEVLDDGEYKLLKRIRIVEKLPDYNLALDVGHRDIRRIRKVEFYLVHGTSATVVSRPKDIIAAVPEQRDRADQFVRSKQLRKGENDLRALVAFLNRTTDGSGREP